MSRRELREHIFKIIFGIEFYPCEELDEQIGLYFEQVPEDEDPSSYPGFATDQDREEITGKVKAIAQKVETIDAALDEASTGWKTSRMGKADLTILRLAVYEMKYDETVPPVVAINEAVELAKKFGSDDSASFVNGILAKLV